jgi:PPIC-type PPIASE domain/SurA N-terminal domain
MRSLSKRTLAFVFAALLAVLVILVGATMGIGKLSLPSGATAFVDEADDGEITQEELDVAIEQAAAGEGGAAEPPQAGTPQYNAALVPALSDLLLGRWVRGEAEERDIEVTDREIDVELQTIIEEQFGGQKEFDKFLDQSGFSEEDALSRVELQLLTQCIQDQVIPQDPEAEAPATERQGCQGEEEVEITDDEIQNFYDDNITQFETPETRDVRTLLNPDEDKAQEAADQLAEDNSAEAWKDVTKELSTEEETAELGGLRQAVAPGQNEPALDDAIFASEEGEVVGPIETDSGFYVIQVEAINEAVTQPLDEETSTQIRQQLVTQEQQQAVTDFQDEFIAKWRARTVCSEDLLADDEDGTVQSQLAERCSNFEVTDDGCIGDDESDELQPDPVTGEVPDAPEGCAAFVPLRPVIPAIPLPQDTADPLATAGGSAVTPLPQGPQPPPQDEEALPPGAEQLGLPGAPPGTAPPGTAPPGTAPPGTAPPGTAPPGTTAPPTQGAPPATQPPG